MARLDRFIQAVSAREGAAKLARTVVSGVVGLAVRKDPPDLCAWMLGTGVRIGEASR